MLSDTKRKELFPSDDIATWNDGTWPPRALGKRWQALHDAALQGVAQRAQRAQSTHVTAYEAARLADWALRVEVERGLYVA